LPFETTSPASQKLLQAIAEACISAGTPEMFGTTPETRPLRIRAHLRETSDIQRVVIHAVRSGLMRRDKRGRFIGLDPKLKVAIRRLMDKRDKEGQPTKAEIRRLQRITFSLIPRS